jgi:hypothetical protein
VPGDHNDEATRSRTPLAETKDLGEGRPGAIQGKIPGHHPNRACHHGSGPMEHSVHMQTAHVVTDTA